MSTTLTKTQRTLCAALDQHVHTIRRQRVDRRQVATCQLADDELGNRLQVTPATARRYRRELHAAGVLHNVKVTCSDGTALLDATVTTRPAQTADLPTVVRLGDRVWRIAADPSSPGARTFLVDGVSMSLEPIGHVESAEGQAALRAQADRNLSELAAAPVFYGPGEARPKGINAVKDTFPPNWLN